MKPGDVLVLWLRIGTVMQEADPKRFAELAEQLAAEVDIAQAAPASRPAGVRYGRLTVLDGGVA